MSVNNATVSIKLGEVSERDISNIRVISKNIGEGLSVSAVDLNSAAITVNLKGVQSVINRINSEDITAYINLSGLGVGTHEVEVQVEGTDARVQIGRAHV